MTNHTRLPGPARWLLRVSPVPDEMRADVQADLLELFDVRRRERGAAHAYWCLCHAVTILIAAATLAVLAPTRRAAKTDAAFVLRQPRVELVSW